MRHEYGGLAPLFLHTRGGRRPGCARHAPDAAAGPPQFAKLPPMIVFSASTMMKPLKKKLSTECHTTVQRIGGAVSTSFG